MVVNTNRDQFDFEMMNSSLSDPDTNVHDDLASDGSDASTVDSEGQIPCIQRTKSQIAKQLQVDHIADQISAREHLINSLQRIVLRLEEEGVGEDRDLRKALAVVTEAQKEARNLGEDLMEDLLKLDCLTNLIPEDRMTRKKALNDIETLLSTVDEAKVELNMFRKKLEAKIAEETSDKDANVDCNAVPTTQREAKRQRSATEENGLGEITVELPPRKVWEQLHLAVQFDSHEERHAYVIEANVPDLDRKDLKLRLSADQSILMVEGVRLPTSAQTSGMQQVVAAQLKQFAQKAPERFTQLGGVSSLSTQAFVKIGQGCFGSFSEKFKIPHDVVIEGISAAYDDGKLKVVLPKQRPVLAHMAPNPAMYLRRHPFQGMPF